MTFYEAINFDGLVKSPSAALRCNFVIAAYNLRRPHSSEFAHLASGAFYFAIHSDDFLRDHQVYWELRQSGLENGEKGRGAGLLNSCPTVFNILAGPD